MKSKKYMLSILFNTKYFVNSFVCQKTHIHRLKIDLQKKNKSNTEDKVNTYEYTDASLNKHPLF